MTRKQGSKTKRADGTRANPGGMRSMRMGF